MSPLDNEAALMRHHPPIMQCEYKIYELNKWLQQRPEDDDIKWWDRFATEFFEDDAVMSLAFFLEDGPKRFSVSRTLIPRFFRTMFEGGVTDLYFILKQSKESYHAPILTVDCEQAMMVTHHGQPMFTKVVAEGRLILDFVYDELAMRIRSWNFQIRQHKELIPRSVIAMHSQDAGALDRLTSNITRQGLTNNTLNFLRLCVILEPMQELMSRHKAYGLQPRDCLKTTLYQKWQEYQKLINPPVPDVKPQPVAKTTRPPTKPRNRKRKASTASVASSKEGPATTAAAAAASTSSKQQKMSPASAPPQQQPPQQSFLPAPCGTLPGDVMVVGEPVLMGGELGDDDERFITRQENDQFEPIVGGDSKDSHMLPPSLQRQQQVHSGTGAIANMGDPSSASATSQAGTWPSKRSSPTAAGGGSSSIQHGSLDAKN